MRALPALPRHPLGVGARHHIVTVHPASARRWIRPPLAVGPPAALQFRAPGAPALARAPAIEIPRPRVDRH